MSTSSRASKHPSEPDSYDVLVIEDDDADWLLIERALSKARSTVFRPSRVSHLANGIVALRHRRYDVILLDLILEFDGPASPFDTVTQVCREAPDTPVIVLSTLGDVEVAVRATELGAENYIEKPPEPNRLELVLRQTIGRHTNDEVMRRLTRQSLEQYGAEDASALAVLIGSHLDNVEGGLHHLVSYLRANAPSVAREIEHIISWGSIHGSMREIRKTLKLEHPSERETWPPPLEHRSEQKKRPRKLSERAMERIRDSSDGSEIKSVTDAHAYLLSLSRREKEIALEANPEAEANPEVPDVE